MVYIKAWIRAIAWFVLKWLIRMRFPSVKRLSTTELAHRLDSDLDSNNGQRPILLDARTFEEYQVSHLPGAQWIGTDNLMNDLLGSDQGDRSELSFPTLSFLPIVIYCSIGYRSARLAQRLQKAGYTNVANLEGSIFAWVNENRPVCRNVHTVRDIHPYHVTCKWLLNEHSHPTTNVSSK
ncbi:MAG TPA: rhodanese-like domain-containing protein [Elainellaceae cyanobacterium]|jgi:rhodanese-related sulfurtransferase